jgi:hypothetical protein
MGVDEPPAEPREELLPHDLHEPGGDDEVGLVGGDGLGESRVPGLSALVVLDPADEGGQPGALGAGQALDAVAVGADGHDLGPVGGGAGLGDGVEERLQVGAGPGDQDDQALGRGLGDGLGHGLGHGGALSRVSVRAVARVSVRAVARMSVCMVVRMLHAP